MRSTLVRLEDTIVFALIERAQWAANDRVYAAGALPLPPPSPASPPPSLLDWLLRATEAAHGAVRRYTAPDEHPFHPDAVPAPLLPPLDYSPSNPLAAPLAASINVNPAILAMYLSSVLPSLTRPGDDGNLGSAAVADVAALQALSKRIHYGAFVAEAKYRASPALYAGLAAARDADGIMTALTDGAVEARVVARVRAKAATFGADVESDGTATAGAVKVDPDAVAAVYRDWVLPLTKEVQVEYLLERPAYDG